jgi:LDH2 family malate/lactate/ureidoglycolate dehydrogenase
VSAGTDEGLAADVARALSSASLRGVDSHGVRLLVHYVRVLKGGRVRGGAVPRVLSRSGGTAIVDADDGFGHPASYLAMAEGAGLARRHGIAAVSVVNSSHFGAAGCYPLVAAEEGLAAFAFCNSDSFVLPYDGLRPFHGTNPIAFAAPVPGARPYLLDMASSVVPWNRIQDYRTRGRLAPAGVGVDAAGEPTEDPDKIASLLPIGGRDFGYKGAALASMIEVLSASITGMAHCARLLSMAGPDLSTPRRLGHFFIVLDPERFVSRDVYEAGILAYLSDLRATPARAGQKVMAPGDREWATEARRAAEGIPIPQALAAEFIGLGRELGVDTAIFGDGSGG